MTTGLFWFLLGLLFLVTDLLAPHLVLAFFGIGAFGAAVTAALGCPLTLQVVTFVGLSLCTLCVLRRTLRTIFSGTCSTREAAVTGASHPLLHRRGTVTRPVSRGVVGEIEVDGSFWRAVSRETLGTGARVRITGVSTTSDLVLEVCSSDRDAQ